MQIELANLLKAIAAETIQTPALNTVRALASQIGDRLKDHLAAAQQIAEQKAADKTAQLSAAAKIVEDAEAEKIAAAKAVAQNS